MNDLFSAAKTRPCSSCGQPVLWITTKNGSATPVDPKPAKVFMLRPGSEIGDLADGYTSHFATCPNADHHRAR